jgi:hypothetical protein
MTSSIGISSMNKYVDGSYQFSIQLDGEAYDIDISPSEGVKGYIKDGDEQILLHPSSKPHKIILVHVLSMALVSLRDKISPDLALFKFDKLPSEKDAAHYGIWASGGLWILIAVLMPFFEGKIQHILILSSLVPMVTMTGITIYALQKQHHLRMKVREGHKLSVVFEQECYDFIQDQITKLQRPVQGHSQVGSA